MPVKLCNIASCLDKKGSVLSDAQHRRLAELFGADLSLGLDPSHQYEGWEGTLRR